MTMTGLQVPASQGSSPAKMHKAPKSLLYNETPLGFYNNSLSFDSSDDKPIRLKLSASASFDRADYFLSSSSLLQDDDDGDANMCKNSCNKANRHRSLSDDDALSRAYAGIPSSQPHHAPLSTKLALLRKQSSDIDSQLAASTTNLTMSERRALLDQKAEIEKTLGLMVQPRVNSIVRKRDSMDLSLLGERHRRGSSRSSGVEDVSIPTMFDQSMISTYSASTYYSAGHTKKANDSLKTIKTHNTSASSGFSNTPQVDDDLDATNANDDSFNVGHLGSREDTFRASDHLFLSDKDIKPVSDGDDNDDDDAKATCHKKKVNEEKYPTDRRLMTYDEYKASTDVAAVDIPSDDTLEALAKINRRRRRGTMSFEPVNYPDNNATTNRRSSGVPPSAAYHHHSSSDFASLSEETMEAFAKINLRRGRRATMDHSASSTGANNTDNSSKKHKKPPNMKPGQGPSLSSNSKSHNQPTGRHASRPSIVGTMMNGLLDTLSPEVAPTNSNPPAVLQNRRSSSGPGIPPKCKGGVPDVRKKGRVYSM